MSDQRERTMTQISKIAATALVRWAVPLAVVGLMWMPASGWSKERRELSPPAAAQSPVPEPSPAALALREPTSGVLGTALAACDKDAETADPLTLPGAKGEVKLDRCYRGRDHLVCSFNALLSEAKSLLENYRKIADANYPELGSVDDVCRIKPDGLATDLQDSTDFAVRFKALRAEYDARANCANRIEQSL